MKNNDYLIPAIAAILVAILYPLFWLFEIDNAISCHSMECMNTTFGFSSILFLVSGLLIVYMYYGLMRLFHDIYNYRNADFPLIALIAITSLFYFGFFMFDIYNAWYGVGFNESIMGFIWMGCLIIFGILDIILAVILLGDARNLSNLLRSFALVSLILGILEISIIFSFAAIFILPISALILAACFLTKPTMVEFV